VVRNCERCHAPPPKIAAGPWAGQSHLLPFCIHCSKDLCEKCIAEGKCRESATGKHEAESDE
jgi:hypothetical protein